MKAKQSVENAEDIFESIEILNDLAEAGEIEIDYDWISGETHYRFDDGSQVIINNNNEIVSIS